MTRGLKRELWQERICNYRSSELYAQAWCQQNKLTLSSLHYWINKLNKESLESDSIFKHEFVSGSTVKSRFRHMNKLRSQHPCEFDDLSTSARYGGLTLTLDRISVTMYFPKMCSNTRFYRSVV
ncbi:MAG: hypothetical protein P4L69_23415 [Desulfosporosinus sp.]|nr:hypothetical protein [Desulfosporosinus sp.]